MNNDLFEHDPDIAMKICELRREEQRLKEVSRQRRIKKITIGKVFISMPQNRYSFNLISRLLRY